jgi:nucleotide-binding universal stress UspA family protein
VDDSAMSEHAVDVAARLARSLGAELAVVHVVDPGRAADPDRGLLAASILDDRREEGFAILSRTVRRVSEAALAARFLCEGNPAHEIVATAVTWNADLIVLASHGRTGIARVVMGSVAENVLRHAPVPVVVVRAPS